MAWEKPFEKMWAAQEVTKGGAVTPPDHDLNASGYFKNKRRRARGTDMGTLSDQLRATTVRKWSEWAIDEQPANVLLAPFVFESAVAGVPAVTTPGGGTLSRLLTFIRDMTSDTLKAMTGYWGDPNLKMFQAAYAMIDELSITSDASGEDPVTWTYGGMAQYAAKLGAVPTPPSTLNPPLLIPGLTQLWIDSASAIGTTEITDRLISAKLTIPTGNTYKYLAQGAAANLGFARTGRKKVHPRLEFSIDAVDLTQYDLWEADTALKVRVRFNGPIIEGSLRNYIEADIYGILGDEPDYGTLEDSNATIDFSIDGDYNSTAGSDLLVRVQKSGATV